MTLHHGRCFALLRPSGCLVAFLLLCVSVTTIAADNHLEAPRSLEKAVSDAPSEPQADNGDKDEKGDSSTTAAPSQPPPASSSWVVWLVVGVVVLLCCGGIIGFGFLLQMFFEKGGRPNKDGMVESARRGQAAQQGKQTYNPIPAR
mmetsp:Transcript_39931/g.92000  ORF Transcript_39931/g.92000 Transcript_39931/m.92000 type:complete len:146 (+) Transcript_39931:48-485(+)